uniref:hypothetical protein n=1 Tax=Providencia alcalifaciens TaxID=126385 RepID=UPI002B05F53A
LDTHTNTINKLEMSGHYMFDNNQQAIQYSAQGMGYVISSHLSIAEYPHLKPRLPQNFIIPLGIYVIYREKTHQTSQVKKVYNDIITGLNELKCQD